MPTCNELKRSIRVRRHVIRGMRRLEDLGFAQRSQIAGQVSAIKRAESSLRSMKCVRSVRYEE